MKDQRCKLHHLFGPFSSFGREPSCDGHDGHGLGMDDTSPSGAWRPPCGPEKGSNLSGIEWNGKRLPPVPVPSPILVLPMDAAYGRSRRPDASVLTEVEIGD